MFIKLICKYHHILLKLSLESDAGHLISNQQWWWNLTFKHLFTVLYNILSIHLEGQNTQKDCIFSQYQKVIVNSIKYDVQVWTPVVSFHLEVEDCKWFYQD